MKNSVLESQKLPSEMRQKLEAFAQLLRKWNHKINLITAADEAVLWERHILDCIRLKHGIASNSMVTDFGSGAGFPGLLLAILGISNVHLIESDQRKIEFLREAARITDTKVTLYCARSEHLEPWKSDVITARAFAPLPRLLTLTHPFCGEDTICYLLKGLHYKEEITEAQKTWNFDWSVVEGNEHQGPIVKITNIIAAKGTRYVA